MRSDPGETLPWIKAIVPGSRGPAVAPTAAQDPAPAAPAATDTPDAPAQDPDPTTASPNASTAAKRDGSRLR
jgi:hypothetical protein